MIDANARSGRMDKAEALFREMDAPDIITYSTLVKGYCSYGDIDKGFAVLRFQSAIEGRRISRKIYNLLHHLVGRYFVASSPDWLRCFPPPFSLQIWITLDGRS